MANLRQSLASMCEAVHSLAALGAHWLLRQPKPRTRGTLRLSGLSAPVEVLRDRWGVPHIYGETTEDVITAQGFVHAQERFWQMDFNRRLVAGRLSEILGPVALDVDRWMRTLTMRRVTEGEVGSLDAESRSLLEAYAAGVNSYLATEPLPLECRVLKYQPEPWILADSLSWVKMMSWTLSVNWETEILRARLVARVGEEAADRLEPTVSEDWVRIVPPGVDYSCIGSDALERAVRSRDLTGPGAREGVGSNSWVLSGSRTATGTPILANDMHLGMSAPAIFFENHLSGGDLHVTGVSFPGLPLVISGHNEDVVWGFTNGFADVQDLYMERLRQTPGGGTEYEFRGEWLPAEVIREEIEVKGAESVVEPVIVTRHGPIINGLIEGEGMESPLALRWTALEGTTTLGTLLAMNQASSCEAFRDALRGWLCPNQNVVSADREGNIAYSYAGRIPIRAKGDGSVPVPGWTGEYEWMDYIPFEELPHLYNPPTGYVVTANNRVVDEGYPHLLGSDFVTGSRARRIVELIEARPVLSVEDVQEMHLDQVSILARETMRGLADVSPDDPQLGAIFKLFRGWDGEISLDGPRAAVYEVFVRRLIFVLMEPRLGELAVRYAGQGPTPILAEGSMFGERCREWLLRTVRDPESPWWETGDGRSRKELVCQAMRETVEVLKELCGPEIGNWAWGKIHKLTFGHPLGSVKPLDRVFERGPYPIGGDGDTVWASGGSRHGLSEARIVGPPFRFIADLHDWNKSLGHLVPGQSGHPASPHYDDGIPGFFTGEYHPMVFDREAVVAEAVERLILEP